MKQGKEGNVLCNEHKEKCAFVCLFKSCKEAFKVGCIRCRKDHSQHPNRLISLSDFHPMYFVKQLRLSRPIRYLQNLTAFKLMNLKKKMEYLRNFRTDILHKQTQLLDSNRNIKSTIGTILEEHYSITDVVSHIDGDTITNNYDQYSDSLLKCKQFLAYNPVKCELVFNNDVIKNSRIQLQKHLKSSHQLIDSIREMLVKIIEVLLANCAHDEDDDQIEFAQEGDSATTFNIFIKNRTDVAECPNIKSKLEHHTFLQMFDEEKEAFTKQIQLLQRQIDEKSHILRKIKGTHHQQQKMMEINAFDDLRSQNKDLKEQLTLLQTQIEISQCKPQQVNQQVETLTQTCTSLASNELPQVYKAEIERLQSDILKQRQYNLFNITKLQNKIQQLTIIHNKQTNEFGILSKRCSFLQQEAAKKKQDQESDKMSSKSNQQQFSKRINDLNGKISKNNQQVQRKERELTKERKKYADLQKLVEKTKENSASIERESQKWREEYQSRQKYFRGELQKCQKELEALKYKSRNDEQRNKNLQARMKELAKELEAKNEILREKDRFLRQKQQLWASKASLHASRLKQLEGELKNSRNSETVTRNYEDQVRKHKQTKDLLEMSIKKGQQLKDRIFQLESQLLYSKEKQQGDRSKNSLMNDSGLILKQVKVEEKKVNGSIFRSEQFHVETVNSEELLQEHERKQEEKKEEPLKERKMVTNREERRAAYLEIKNIFRAVSEDMGVLEERLKENSVIQKVYLKELQRKRNQNKLLKKELDNLKLYGNNFKNTTENPPNHNPRKEAKSPSLHANKVQPLSGMRKKA